MTPLPYNRPLLKLSGEALMGEQEYGVDVNLLGFIAADIANAFPHKSIPIVVGGGNIFRGLTAAASGMDRVKADQMGMLATIMNALALAQAFKHLGRKATIYTGLPAPTVCETFSRDRATADLDAGTVVILAGGTGNPFFTTDTTATLRAAELGCDAVLKATMVDGVYSADPKRDPGAVRYDHISFSDVLTLNLKIMDAAAIALARDNSIPIVIFSLMGKSAITHVMRGEIARTIVAPDG